MNDDELLNDLLDSRLVPADEAALRARIEAEPTLREAWEELQRVRALVRDHASWAASIEPPAALAAAVRARTTGGTDAAPTASPGPRPAGRMLRMLMVSYAAAALVVAALTVRWALEDPGAETLDASGGKTTTAARDEKQVQAVDARARGDELASRRNRIDETVGLARLEEEKQPPAGEPKGGFSMGGSVPPKLRAPHDAGEAPPPPPPPAASRPEPQPKSRPGPGDELRRERSTETRPGEWLYVIEADDAEEGLREARRLLASLADAPSRVRKSRLGTGRVQPAEAELEDAGEKDAESKDAKSKGARGTDSDDKSPDKKGAAPSSRLRAFVQGSADEQQIVTSISKTLSAASHRRLQALVSPPPPAAGKKGEVALKESGVGKAKAGGVAPTPAAGAPSTPPADAPAPGGSGVGGSGAGGKRAEPVVRVRILILRRR